MAVLADILEFLTVLLKTVAITIVMLYRSIIPPTPKSVREKVILVTGTGSGLGKLLAQKFALLGARLILVDFDEIRNNETFQYIRQMQCKVHAYTCDISNENQVEELGDKIALDVGTVDILINNAGVMSAKPLMELTNEQIKRSLQVNTLSHFWTIRKFLPGMIENGEGQIVAIASVAGLLGASNLVDYCASKHAVMGLMSALREELHDIGKEDIIQLTVICPSTMNTGMAQNPKTRFPKLLPILNVEDVSDKVINAVLGNKKVLVIPTIVHIIYKVANLFPPQVPIEIQRFLGYIVDPNTK